MLLLRQRLARQPKYFDGSNNASHIVRVQLRGCEPHPPAVAGESSTLLLTVLNLNDIAVVVDAIDVSGPFEVPLDQPPFELPPGFGSTITVEFEPLQPGQKTGEVILDLNAPPDELRCALSGEAR